MLLIFKSHGLNHREFRAFFEVTKREYCDIAYCFEVRRINKVGPVTFSLPPPPKKKFLMEKRREFNV
jgi:hypothetical protein